jgi:hypothetical protein
MKGNWIMNKIKKVLISFSAGLLLFGGIAPSFALKASADEVQVQTAQVETSSTDTEIFKPVVLTEDAQQQILKNELKSSMIVSGKDGTEVASVSDIEMMAALENAGYYIDPAINRQVLLRGAGVTKLVWYGNKKVGNFNVYVSKYMLQVFKYASAAYNVFMAAFSAYFGNFINSAVNMMRATFKVIKAGTISNGKVYYSRSWWYKGSGTQ